MRIALIGYGKMGKAIEEVAIRNGHEIVFKITQNNKADLKLLNNTNTDCAIEFSRPDSAIENINICLASNIPIVVGTTGWYDKLDFIQENCKKHNGSILHATNFSIGVNIFFELNKALAKVMKKYSNYRPSIDETHHTQKLDAPSGTAITLSEGILKEYPNLIGWEDHNQPAQDKLKVKSHRIENVPGTHEISYSSKIDDISIKHTAHNREGFAAGAVLAAEWLTQKKGIYTMSDLLNVNFS